jgi:WD40 repeat protein
LAVICETGEVLLLDVANGELHTWLDRDDSKTSHINPLVTFTSDGTVLVSLGPDGWIRVWDAASGELKYPALVSGKDGFWSFALSTDNRHMATATMDGEVRIWDLQTGLPRPSILQHPGWVYRCRFSPDQKRLITASHDGKVRIWNWSAGKLLGSLLVHPNEVYDAVFTPDSRWVLTACRDGNVRIWDPESSQLVAPPIKVGQQAFNIEITRSGHHAIVGTLGNDLYVLSLETFHKPLPFDVEDLCLVGEVVSGCTVENGHLRDLTTAEWLDRYARIQSLHPEAMESGQAYAIRKHAFDKASIFTGDCSDPSADSKDEDTTVAARPYPSAPSRTLPAKEGCTARCDQCRFSKSLKEG